MSPNFGPLVFCPRPPMMGWSCADGNFRILSRYPPAGWSVLKVLLLLCGIAVGMAVGKFFVHQQLLRKRVKLRMFQEDQGSWMIMFLTTIISLFVFSHIFNGFLSLGSDLDRYKLSSFFGVSNANFMKFAALGTWTGDFVTAWMVTDIMLQVSSHVLTKSTNNSNSKRLNAQLCYTECFGRIKRG